MNPTFLKRHKRLSETYLCDVTVLFGDDMKCECLGDGVEEVNLQGSAPENQIMATKFTGNILEGKLTQIIVCEITTFLNYVVFE